MSGNIKLANLPIVWKVFGKIKNWNDYFLDLFALTGKKQIIYRMNNGLKYLVRAKTSDRGILTTVDLEDEYKVSKLVFPKDSVAIDIGAQIGIFSVYLSKKADKIFLYEPVPENYKMILENIKINRLNHKIIPFNLAVSDKKEKIKIFLSETNTGMHSIYGKGKYVEAKTTTIKEIFDKNRIKKCSLLKMDVEGSEYRILQNLPDAYFKKIERIRMECHDFDGKRNHKIIIELLKSKGFKIMYKHPILFAERY